MAKTTGFVQKFSWLSSGPTACFWVGSGPDSAELFSVQFASGDSNSKRRFNESLIWVLNEALLAGLEVEVMHSDGSSKVTGVATVTCSTTTTPLQVDSIEVTQAVQDLGHSIPLFSEKRTVVRVYLSYYTNPGITVRGELLIRRGPTDTPVTVGSANTVVLDPSQAGDIPAKRNGASRSLNFVLPNSHITEGPLRIRVASIINTVTDSTVSFDCARRPAVWFHDTAPVRVRVLGMRYTQSELTHTPSTLDFNLIESWLRRAMPTGQVNISTAIIDATASVPFGSGDINAQVAAIRAMDVSGGTDARTHYYGLVSDGGFFMRGGAAGIPHTPQPGTVASGPTGNSTWGWDSDGSYGDWYTGHELGHTYGRRHPGFCGESESDLDNYPFENGQLANSNTSFAGFDVGDPVNSLVMAALPGTQWHDVMTYCDFQWLSPYTYLGIRRRLVAEDALPAGAGMGRRLAAEEIVPTGLNHRQSVYLSSGGRPDRRFPHRKSPRTPQNEEEAPEDILISVVATVNLTSQKGKIQFVNPLERATISGMEEESSTHLRVKGSDGQILGDYRVEVKISSEIMPGEDRTGIVDTVLTVGAETRSIELMIENEVVDTIRIGGGLPETETIHAPRIEDTGRTDIRISAEVENEEEINDYLTYSVQVSDDNGQTWQTVGVGLKEPAVSLDRSQFRQGQDVQIRVITTNGLKSTVVTTEKFRI